MSPIVQYLPRSRHQKTARGYCIAILIALALAIVATVVKAATGHSIAGLLVFVMVLAGAFSLAWDFATKERH